MIRFSCVCGEAFEVPTSEAGESFQCQNCRRLVDVPMLSDLASLNDDGTLKLDEHEPSPQELAQKMHAFGYRHDMRNSMEDVLSFGVNPSEGVSQRFAPRYDPETGELVVPIDIRPDPLIDQPDEIPMASPVLGYSNITTSDVDRKHSLKWWSMPWHLLTGMSLMAMLFVYLAHAFIAVGAIVPAFNVFVVIAAFGIFIATVAHYVNTIEDIGPQDRDDIPVYLRNLSLSDDLLRPFGAFLLAGIYVQIPMLIALLCGLRHVIVTQEWVEMAFLGWAGVAFPAVLFTTVCSGALQNLMPQRVLSVVLAAPAQYALVIAAFWSGCMAYSVALRSIHFAPVSSLQAAVTSHVDWMPILIQLGVSLGIFAIAVYLMHLAAAWMGLIYRTHYPKFNWVLQRHEPTHRDDTTARLLKMHMNRKNAANLTAEAQARLAYVRQADAERRHPTKPKTGFPVQPKLTSKTPRGFEI